MALLYNNKIIPNRLPSGATIGLVAPASPQHDESRLERGIQYLESLGYRVEIGKSLYNRHLEYLAGTDEERCSDIESMFSNPAIDAIFCVRGGYGTMRFLHQLDFDIIRHNPKIFVGFSDITALQLAVFAQTGLITFSGAMPSVEMADESGSMEPETEESFWAMLTGDFPSSRLVDCEYYFPVGDTICLHEGGQEGTLLGGNLTLLASLCGSPYVPSWKDAIVVIEEVSEEPYRVDRMLAQLWNSGALQEAGAILFGQCSMPKSQRSVTNQPSMEAVLQDYATRCNIACISNFLYGHQKKKLTLPIGATVQMQADSTQGNKLTLKEPVVHCSS
jgi:muramoyltetrapeptide carboxypeptidase